MFSFSTALVLKYKFKYEILLVNTLWYKVLIPKIFFSSKGSLSASLFISPMESNGILLKFSIESFLFCLSFSFLVCCINNSSSFSVKLSLYSFNFFLMFSILFSSSPFSGFTISTE